MDSQTKSNEQFISQILNTSNFHVGLATDIGGSKENQDDVLCFQTNRIVVNCIIDGHGEHGKLIANTIRETVKILTTEQSDKLIADPISFILYMYRIITDSIVVKIRQQSINLGRECVMEDNGVFMERDPQTNKWNAIRCGGATMTICILIKETLKLYIANVGDSDAMLCSNEKILSTEDINQETELETPTIKNENQHQNSNNILLTANHSLSNVDEYKRMRNFACCDENSNSAKLNVVYDDAFLQNKASCKKAFDTSTSTPVLMNGAQNNGYYKNVRKEYAMYGLTSTKRLAFTRTLGDFEMYPYGISNVPNISSIELEPIFERCLKTSDKNKTLCLVVSSDGVWDNWEYKDVQEFVMYPNCLEAVHNDNNGVDRVINSFMERNRLTGIKNFGNTRDNATTTMLYISKPN